MEGKLDLAIELLTGNGNPSKGLIVIVDRLREKMKLVWAALIVAIGAAWKAFYSG